MRIAKRIQILIFAVGAMSSLLFFFNNCAQSYDDGSSGSAPTIATEIVGPILSGIRLTTIQGKVQGWALDNGRPEAILRVLFYLNGDATSGTYLGEAIANDRLAGPYEGHFFNFQVPSYLIDGKPHPLYIYVHEAKPENIIYPAPYSIVGYQPKAKEYYDANIAPFLVSNNCVSCHRTEWSYLTLFYGPLTDPYPISGGTATNNTFFRKMSGVDGHNGGAYCGANGTNPAFCDRIQAWWRAEFE